MGGVTGAVGWVGVGAAGSVGVGAAGSVGVGAAGSVGAGMGHNCCSIEQPACWAVQT